jgi:uncharacterized protein (UPF0147 family)
MRVEEVVRSLSALKEENDVSRRFKEKTEEIITLLSTNSAMAIEKALSELEELNSYEISSYHRTQVWDIVSMLESIKI